MLIAELTDLRADQSKLPKSSEGPMVLISANARTVHFDGSGKTFDLPFPGGPQAIGPGPFGILLADISYHFRADIVLAGAGGFRLFGQALDGSFTDVTASTK